MVFETSWRRAKIGDPVFEDHASDAAVIQLASLNLRENPINDDTTNQVDNGGDEEGVDSTLTCDITPGFVEEIQPLGLEEEKDNISIDSTDAHENHD